MMLLLSLTFLPDVCYCLVYNYDPQRAPLKYIIYVLTLVTNSLIYVAAAVVKVMLKMLDGCTP
jgi:hypothetical protein